MGIYLRNKSRNGITVRKSKPVTKLTRSDATTTSVHFISKKSLRMTPSTKILRNKNNIWGSFSIVVPPTPYIIQLSQVEHLYIHSIIL